MPIYKTYTCIHCNQEVTKANSREKFCSIQCQKDNERNQFLNDWIEGLETGNTKYGLSKHIRKYIFQKYNNSCSCCGIKEWNGKPITLQIEHIDGNFQNNKEINLTLLCPNCHSQTDTFGNRNKGNGRYWRRERYAEGKSS